MQRRCPTWHTQWCYSYKHNSSARSVLADAVSLGLTLLLGVPKVSSWAWQNSMAGWRPTGGHDLSHISRWLFALLPKWWRGHCMMTCSSALKKAAAFSLSSHSCWWGSTFFPQTMQELHRNTYDTGTHRAWSRQRVGFRCTFVLSCVQD